jgi:hypothetical protein
MHLYHQNQQLLRVVRLIRLMKVARLLKMSANLAALENSGSFAASGLKLVKVHTQ